MNKMRESRAQVDVGRVLRRPVLLAGCASPRRAPAPVEDRTRRQPAARWRPRRRAPAGRSTPSRCRARRTRGKPGYYTVKPGDTLIRIALETARTGATSRAGTTSTTRT